MKKIECDRCHNISAYLTESEFSYGTVTGINKMDMCESCQSKVIEYIEHYELEKWRVPAI